MCLFRCPVLKYVSADPDLEVLPTNDCPRYASISAAQAVEFSPVLVAWLSLELDVFRVLWMLYLGRISQNSTTHLCFTQYNRSSASRKDVARQGKTPVRQRVYLLEQPL